MFIKHFEVANYKCHRFTALDLHPITAFVGSNNGGKSALFDALLNFSMVSRGRLSQAFGLGPYSYQAIRHHGVSPNANIRYSAELARRPGDVERLRYTVAYSARSPLTEPISYAIREEKLERLDTRMVLFDRAIDACAIPGVRRHLTEDQSLFAAIRRAQVLGDFTESATLLAHVTREISRMNKFRMAPENLARPSRLPDTKVDNPEEGRAPRIDYEGRELAGVLYYLAEIESPALSEIIARLRAAVAGFEGFEFNAVGTDGIGFSARFGDDRGVVAAANLSAGTLSLIGLLTLLLGPSRPPVLLLEEPENGLTPRSTRAVYETVLAVTAATAESPSQILISSHSPFLIVEAWNGDERDFIYHVKVLNGKSEVRSFADTVEGKGMLRMDKGKRRELGLRFADELMDGYLS